MFAGVVRTAAVVGRCHAHQVSVRAFPAVMGGVSAVGGVLATQCGVGAVRGVVTVRIRNTSLVSYKRVRLRRRFFAAARKHTSAGDGVFYGRVVVAFLLHLP